MLLGDGPQWFSGSKVFLLIVYLLGTWAALVCHPREGPPARQDLPPPPQSLALSTLFLFGQGPEELKVLSLLQ